MINIPPRASSATNPNILEFRIRPFCCDGTDTPYTAAGATALGSRFAILRSTGFDALDMLDRTWEIAGQVWGPSTAPVRAKLHKSHSTFHCASPADPTGPAIKTLIGHPPRTSAIGEDAVSKRERWTPMVITKCHFTINVFTKKLVIGLSTGNDQRDDLNASQIYIPVYHESLRGVRQEDGRFRSIEDIAGPLVLD